LLLVLVGHRSIARAGVFGRSPAAMQAEIKKVAIAGRRSFAVQRLDYRVRRQSSGIEFRRQERSVQAPALMDERKAQRVK